MIEALYQMIAEPLAFEFMRRGLAIACVVGAVCAAFSCFLVLKGWSLMGDAVSHAVLPGIVLAYVAGLPLSLGAFTAGLGCAVLTGFIKDHSRVKEDAVMGIIFSGMFALGIVLMTRVHTDLHLMHVLFGNILGTAWEDLAEALFLGVPVFLIILFKRRDLMLYCFDPVQAQASGISGKLMHYGLLILLALSIVVSLKVAGIILVIAMLIAPGAIAFLLARRFDTMLAIAIVCALASCFSGVIVSYHIDAAPAPLIVVIQSVIFMVALTFSPRTGIFRGAGLWKRSVKAPFSVS